MGDLIPDFEIPRWANLNSRNLDAGLIASIDVGIAALMETWPVTHGFWEFDPRGDCSIIGCYERRVGPFIFRLLMLDEWEAGAETAVQLAGGFWALVFVADLAEPPLCGGLTEHEALIWKGKKVHDTPDACAVEARDWFFEVVEGAGHLTGTTKPASMAFESVGVGGIEVGVSVSPKPEEGESL